jgi:hypothetical protein
MMQPIRFCVKLFRGEWDRPRSQVALLKLMEALAQMNEGHLAQMKYPSIYESGVRYRREERSENWQDIPSILEAGAGDCEDLACWRIAELRRAGKLAFPYLAFQKLENGSYRYHALVERFVRYDRSAGKFHGQSLEDPSRRLGMGGPNDPAYYAARVRRAA